MSHYMPDTNRRCKSGLAFYLFMILWAVQNTASVSANSPDPLATSLGYQSRYIEANGHTFHYVEKGKGEVILFLHGYPFFWYGWHNVLQRFATTHRVIAPDNRGYNLSGKPETAGSYHLTHLVADVASQITQLTSNKKVILVGHDWGGTLAWAVAQKHPELLERLVVINAPPYNVLLDMLQSHPIQRQTSAYMEVLKSGKVEQSFEQNGPIILWNYGFNKRLASGEMTTFDKEAYFSAWRQPGAMRGALNWYRANIPKVESITADHYWPHQAAMVSVPSLLIWTEGEKVFVPEVKAETAKIVPNLTTVTLKGSGHAPFLDKPEEVTQVMRAFFNGEDASAMQFNSVSPQ